MSPLLLVSPLQDDRQLVLNELQQLQTVGHPHHQGVQSQDQLVQTENLEVFKDCTFTAETEEQERKKKKN